MQTKKKTRNRSDAVVSLSIYWNAKKLKTMHKRKLQMTHKKTDLCRCFNISKTNLKKKMEIIHRPIVYRLTTAIVETLNCKSTLKWWWLLIYRPKDQICNKNEHNISALFFFFIDFLFVINVRVRENITTIFEIVLATMLNLLNKSWWTNHGVQSNK